MAKTYTYHSLYGTYDVHLRVGKYWNGRLAINLDDAYDDMPVATATVNVHDEELSRDEVIIKDYSENQGMLEFITRNSIGMFVRTIVTGHVACPVVKLLMTPDEIVNGKTNITHT